MAYGIVSSQTTAQTTAYLEDVASATAVAGSQQVSLTWSDPPNVELNGATLAIWDKTLVVRKTGSVPADHNDGTVIVTNTVRDQYKTTPFVDSGLTNGTVYYYRFFPVSKKGAYTNGSVVNVRPAATKVSIPTVTSTHTYTGQSQTPTVSGFNSNTMNKSGDTSGTNAGNYNLVFTLKNNSYVWSNGQYSAQSVPWSIAKAAGSLSLNKSIISLTPKSTFSTVTITQIGDGELSIQNSNPSIVSAVISGTTLTVSKIGTNIGEAVITISAAESTNYTAAQAVVAVSSSNYRTMTLKIDESNSNPDTMYTYADDAVNMEPGSDDWDEFFGLYPVLFQNGAEVVKLNPNNLEQDIDGNAVDISSGNSGDAMIAVPRRGLKISKSGNIVTISMTDNLEDDTFEYMAHKRGDTLKNKFYLGIYPGSSINNRLRSLKNQSKVDDLFYSPAIAQAEANGAPNGNGGSGYDPLAYYQATYFIAMSLLKYKKTVSRSDAPNDSLFNIMSDEMNNNGIITTNIVGMTYDVDFNIWTATENYSDIIMYWKYYNVRDNPSNDTYSLKSDFTEPPTPSPSYINRGPSGNTHTINNGYVSKIVGTTHGGFLGLEPYDGSSTTYYRERSTQHRGCTPTWYGSTLFRVGEREYKSDDGTHKNFYWRLMYL